MKSQKIKLKSDFSQLLTKLGDSKANACLLTGSGGGWQSRLAWQPRDSYTLNTGQLDQAAAEKFIARHQAAKHLVVGFVSYELGYSLHNIKPAEKDDLKLPQLVLFAYDQYLEKRGNDTYAYYQDAAFVADLAELDDSTTGKSSSRQLPQFNPTWQRQSYKQAFEKIKNYIFEGDIYQINLTQRLQANSDISPRQLFARLADENTAKMMAYLEGNDFELISMSPERFIQTTGRTIETSPIKGTQPRGQNIFEDKLNKRKLINDEKEKAELNMITDLLRNDLGKVCVAGSVEVVKTRQIEKLTTVMHSFSLIRGQLQPEVTPFAALISMFPGGSVTGCPKKRAMQIIDQLEPTARSAYCGCIFAVDSEGDLDSNILIRTIIKKDKKLVLSVGSGIVNDSIEQKEYQENLDKAAAISRNLG